jgi:chloramphenicol 3-O phosphotransferase
MTNNSVQIIYLNGPSSSGKTTLAKAIQHEFEAPFLYVSIDKIIGWMPEKINDWTGGIAPLGYSWKEGTDPSGNPIQELQMGPFAEKIAKTFQQVALTLAEMGHDLIIDDVPFGKNQVEEWKELLKRFKVLWVGVNAPLPILEQREKERGNRIIGSARGQFYKVHVDATYDLTIDTHHTTLAENIERIKSSIAERKQENGQSIRLRPLEKTDLPQIIEHYSFPWSTPEKTAVLWHTYYEEQEKGIRTVAIIEKKQKIVGYGSLLRQSECPFFLSRRIPDVNAVWIHEDYRKQGLGTALIQWIEDLAAQEGYEHIGIGVGLYRDYGSAQRLYFQLGYIPDGSGITYRGQPTVAGQSYPLDDDLLLWLVKPLSKTKKPS